MGFEPKYRGKVSRQPQIELPTTFTKKKPVSKPLSHAEVLVISVILIAVAVALIWLFHTRDKGTNVAGPAIVVMPSSSLSGNSHKQASSAIIHKTPELPIQAGEPIGGFKNPNIHWRR